MTSEQDAAAALRRREELEVVTENLRARLAKTKLAQQLDEAEHEYEALSEALDVFVLNTYDGGLGYDDGVYKLTKVVGHTRIWDVERLQEILPRGAFKAVTTVIVIPAKIDELIGAGRITLDQIEPAFSEREKKPYVKTTVKRGVDGQQEADELAAKLG